MKSSFKKNLFAYITLAVCAGIMIYFLISTGGVKELYSLFVNLRARWLVAAFAAAVMVWVMEAASFHAISIHVYRGWKFAYSFVSAMVGLLYSAITPFSTGGQPMQVYSLHKKGMSTGAAGAIVAVRSLVYQVALMLFSLLMVVLRLTYFTENVSGFSALLLVGLAINIGYVLFLILVMRSPKTTDKIVFWAVRLLARLKLCKDPEARYEKIHTQLTLFHENIKMLGKSVKMYARAILCSVFQFVFQCLIPYFLYVAFFYDTAIYHKEDILTIMAAQAFVLMVSYFIPTPGAAGGAEISFFGFFGSFYHSILTDANEAGRLVNASGTAFTAEEITEMSSSKLASTMFLWRFISFYFTILAGSFFVSHLEKQKPLKLENRLFDESALGKAPAEEAAPADTPPAE